MPGLFDYSAKPEPVEPLSEEVAAVAGKTDEEALEKSRGSADSRSA